jgi:uncharacterized protein HemY
MNINNTFFSPLNKDSCFYFYVLTVFFFIAMIIATISGLIYIVTKPSKITFNFITHFILIVINFFLVYFVNRLYFSMCVNSLK